MDNLDKLIQEKIKNEYNDITPDFNKIQTSIKEAKKNYNKKQTIIWKHFMTAAAIFFAIIFLFNVDSVKALVMEIYEKYFTQVQRDFENNTEDYIQNLDLEYNIEGEKIIIKEYVVTDKGVDFKIISDENSKVHICACEIVENDNQTYNEMLVGLDEYFIASNIVENIELMGKIKVKISLLYYLDGKEDNLYTKEMEATLDCSKIYNIKTVSSTEKYIAKNDSFEIKNISLHTWYMKVVYENYEEATNNILLLNQEGKDIVCASGKISGDEIITYYQLPEAMDFIEATLGYFDNNGMLQSKGTAEKIELKKLFKEDTNE